MQMLVKIGAKIINLSWGLTGIPKYCYENCLGENCTDKLVEIII